MVELNKALKTKGLLPIRRIDTINGSTQWTFKVVI